MKYDKVAEHITNWLKNYVENTPGVKGFVIGVSGGIDSAVSSTLCAKTGLPLIVVEMPIHQDYRQVTIAGNHIKWLKENFPNVTSTEVDLSKTFDDLYTILTFSPGAGFGDDMSFGRTKNLALANTRSRLRMVTLYAIANLHQYIVCGTGNKVEDHGVKFFTKYGDGGVDISPIGDLMKSDVYALGKEMGLIEEILNTVPTDGLWEGSPTDEDQIGATYDELEWAMNFVDENWFWETGMECKGFLDYDFETNKSKVCKEDFNLSGREKEVLKIYLKMHETGAHKMEMPPVCLIPDEYKTSLEEELV